MLLSTDGVAEMVPEGILYHRQCSLVYSDRVSLRCARSDVRVKSRKMGYIHTLSGQSGRNS